MDEFRKMNRKKAKKLIEKYNLKECLEPIARNLLKEYLINFSKIKYLKFDISYIDLDRVLNDYFKKYSLYLDFLTFQESLIDKYPEEMEQLVNGLDNYLNNNKYIHAYSLVKCLDIKSHDFYGELNETIECCDCVIFEIKFFKDILHAGMSFTKHREIDDQDDGYLSNIYRFKLLKHSYKIIKDYEDKQKHHSNLMKEISFIPGGKGAEEAQKHFEQIAVFQKIES